MATRYVATLLEDKDKREKIYKLVQYSDGFDGEHEVEARISRAELTTEETKAIAGHSSHLTDITLRKAALDAADLA